MQRLSILVALLIGCAADTGGEAMQIRQNLAPDQDCGLDASVMSGFFSRGSIDMRSTVPYVMTPLIESRITALTGQESQRTVQLRGARIDLELGPMSIEDTNGNVSILEFTDEEQTFLDDSGATKFRSLFAAPLAPNGGLTTAHFDAVSVPALAAIRSKAGTAAGTRVHAQVTATVVIYGDLAGDEVEGVPYVYPITVCNDCVINVVSLFCPAPMGTMVRTGNACNLYQDGVVDCCVRTDGLLECPATIATM